MSKPTNPKKHAFMFTDDIKFLQKAIVFHPKGDKFLALKRSADSFSRPNDWDLAGGNVLYGELHDDSLKKEIKEETDLTVSEFLPVQVVTNYDNKKKIYTIFIGYFCKAKSDIVKISKEHSEFRWVTGDEFIKLEPAEYLVNLVNKMFEKQNGA